MQLTQQHKEHLINIIENYTSYAVYFSCQKGSIQIYNFKATQFPDNTDELNIVVNEDKVSYLYRDEVFENPPLSFSPITETNETLFEIFRFCIENDLSFSKNNTFRIYSPYIGCIYIDLKEKSLEETLKFLKEIIVQEDSLRCVSHKPKKNL